MMLQWSKQWYFAGRKMWRRGVGWGGGTRHQRRQGVHRRPVVYGVYPERAAFTVIVATVAVEVSAAARTVPILPDRFIRNLFFFYFTFFFRFPPLNSNAAFLASLVLLKQQRPVRSRSCNGVVKNVGRKREGKPVGGVGRQNQVYRLHILCLLFPVTAAPYVLILCCCSSTGRNKQIRNYMLIHSLHILPRTHERMIGSGRFLLSP